MRVLYVTTYQRTGGWLAEALAADSAADVVLEEAVGFAAGLARLRDELFDAVLISHEPGELDALALADALRTAGSEEPVVVLGEDEAAEMMALCLEAKADAYLCVQATTTRALIWTVARAIERHTLLRENRRLAQADRHRLELERDEARRLIGAQRKLIDELDELSRSVGSCANTSPGSDQSTATTGELDASGGAERARSPLPVELEKHYRELLRAYVMMGSGNLADEMQALAHLLAAAGISAAQTLQLHLHVLAALLEGLGNRSARHVMNRADLLALEITAHLCEVYRQQGMRAAG